MWIVANFLNSMGARHPWAPAPMPSRSRAWNGSAAAPMPSSPTRSRQAPIWPPWPPPAVSVLVKNIIPKHMDCITAKLVEMRRWMWRSRDALLVRRHSAGMTSSAPMSRRMPYPGFPTDMQPQMTAVLCLAQGHQPCNRGRLEQPVPLCGRVQAHGRSHPGGWQDRRH